LPWKAARNVKKKNQREKCEREGSMNEHTAPTRLESKKSIGKKRGETVELGPVHSFTVQRVGSAGNRPDLGGAHGVKYSLNHQDKNLQKKKSTWSEDLRTPQDARTSRAQHWALKRKNSDSG